MLQQTLLDPFGRPDAKNFFFFYFDLTQYTKFNLFKSMRWFIGLNGIVKAMKLLGGNRRKS